MSGCCSPASCWWDGANSSHSRLTKLLIRENNLLEGPPSTASCNTGVLSSPAPRSCAISTSWCWRWSPVPLYHLLPSLSLSFPWSRLLSFSHCGKPLLRILILCLSLCHRCYSPDWQSRSSSIADPPLGLAAELLLSWDSICRPQLSDCMRWFMWERGGGNPAGIKIQKTAMQCSLHILNYSAEHVASLIICLFLLMIKNAYFNYNLPSVHSICPSNIYFFTNCCV